MIDPHKRCIAKNGSTPVKPQQIKKQISFADTETRIMGKKGHFDLLTMPRSALIQTCKSLP